ncbi:baeRF3 domain-containing protein [Stutzerimonas chloritidismutans]|uniref:baeRF3 domain-containing protein n=1 Tax=Stutzerimonas chloritidismutans TaxID=203192 RepID=UPI003F165FDA
MNRLLDRETLSQLLAKREAPCLSLYQPTHRSFPERQQDPIRFKHLVRQLQDSLKQQGRAEHAKTLLKPFHELLDDTDFWNSNRDGLAVFAAADYFDVFRLQRSVPELAVANDRMHLKPLLRIAQSADRYQILAINLDSIRLFEGNRDGIDEVKLAAGVPKTIEEALGRELTEKGQTGFPQGYSRASERGDPMQVESGGAGRQDEIDRDRERFFREVDRAILEHHSRTSRLPLILAALPEHQFHFRKLSHNEFLLPEGIEHDVSLLSADELRDKSWMVKQPRYIKRLEGFIDQYGESHGQGLATDQLDQIGQATVAGRVATLLVEADRQIPGVANKDEGKAIAAEGEAATTPDLLDELTIWTLEQGGEVIAVPTERMPTESGAAAIYRY